MAQIAASSQFTTSSRPSNSAWISSESYVIAIASLPDHYAAAASAPSNLLEIYDKQSLQRIQALAGHDVSVSSLKTVDNIAGFARQSLVSSGHDGSVKVWDDRSNSHSIKSALNPFLSCHSSIFGSRSTFLSPIVTYPPPLFLSWRF